MTLQEAIAVLHRTPDRWIRPANLTWIKSGQAYTLSNDSKSLLLVPTFKGGAESMTNLVDDLLSHWESVPVSVVLAERERDE
jgi:hypothetical protein